MFAVRNIFSRPERSPPLCELTARRELPRWLADSATRSASSFMRRERAPSPRPPTVSRARAGGRASSSAPATRTICGPRLALAPPLPLADRLTLTKLFGRLSGVGLDPPDSMPGFSSS
jgi:hypothetical protein